MGKSLFRVVTGWFLAELVATLLLALVFIVGVLGSAAGYQGYHGYQSLFVPWAMGLTYFFLTWGLQRVTGAHANPAITLSQFLLRQITPLQTLVYLPAQFLGGWLGAVAAYALTKTPLSPPDSSTVAIVLGEFIGTAILGYALMVVRLRKATGETSAVFVGAALATGLTIAGITGGGFLNPALVVGIGVFRLTYLGVPLLGALTGAGLALIFEETAKETAALLTKEG